MNVYMITMENGESYEDYRIWTEALFMTYRGASEYLIGQGFNVNYSIAEDGEHYIYFEENPNEYPCCWAEISEMEVMNK